MTRSRLSRLSTWAVAALLGTTGATAVAQFSGKLPPNSVLGNDTLGSIPAKPVVSGWSAQKHQNYGGLITGHTYLWGDQNNVALADKAAVQTQDASVLWHVGLGGGGAGQTIGLQATVDGVQFNLYISTPGDTTTAAGLLSATINGSVMSAAVATAGTTVVDGQTYALNIPTSTCFSVPRVIATASGGVMSAAAVTGSDGSSVWGGACTGTITNPVALVGTDATVNVTQASTAFINATLAYTDANGFGYQPTASHSLAAPTQILFDFPWGPNNSIKACAAVVGTGGEMGTACPAGTGWEIDMAFGDHLDTGPLHVVSRFVPGRAPVPGDQLGNHRFDGASGPNTGIDTQYGTANLWVGGHQIQSGAATVSGTNVTLSGDPRFSNIVAALADGFYVTDATFKCAIPNGTTIASGGGTVNLVLSQPVACTGVANGDNLYFVDPANPVGRLRQCVADISSRKSPGTCFIIAGSKDFDSGYDWHATKDAQGLLINLGVDNSSTGTGTAAALSLRTGSNCSGVPCSFAQKVLTEAASSSSITETFGQYISGYTLKWNVNSLDPKFVIDNAALTQFGLSSSVPNHLTTGQATAPALTSCGGGTPTIIGTDTAGTVAMGTTATGCVITFNVAYVSAPHCVVTWQATPLASQSYAISNTAITLTQTSTSSNLVNYVCFGQAAG